MKAHVCPSCGTSAHLVLGAEADGENATVVVCTNCIGWTDSELTRNARPLPLSSPRPASRPTVRGRAAPPKEEP
jgi:hypothetical protein